jgi:hypothetical protein
MFYGDVYAAGPISGLSYGDSTDWRGYVDKNIDPKIQVWSPMRHKEYLAGESQIEGSYEDTIMSSQKGIMARDHFDTTRVKVVLVNLLGAKRVSIGTVIEIAWTYPMRTPVVLAIEDGNVNCHIHPMLLEAVGFRSSSLDECIATVERILIPEGKLDVNSMAVRLARQKALQAA